MLPSLKEIARKRRMLGLTQKELAKLAGVSQSFIAKIESGKISPSYTRVKAIFDVLFQLENRLSFRAKHIMHNEVVGVQKEDSVSRAVQLMMDYGYSQLPVFDGERVVGSISERTILNLIASGRDIVEISSLPVEEVMDEAFPQVDENTPLTLISSLLQVYPAVLVLRKGRVVGIITKADLLKMLK
ncbi:MAG TPA: CBS domain-containing protein [Candidatus Atribacteria bacterium]|nr:CBS domain-containing protein [Candidatus Atribacteria bacterium]